MSGCQKIDIPLGSFRHSVQVQNRVRADDAHGGEDTTWSNAFVIRCSIEEKSGSEGFREQKLNTDSTIVLNTRFRSDITTIQRLTFSGKFYNIRRVDDVKRLRQFITITADLQADRDA